MTQPAHQLWLATAFLCSAPLAAFAHANTDSVADTALVEPAKIVDCTLENGDTAQCAAYEVKYLPDTLEIGPFCPATLDDVGGIWNWDGENAGLYRIDGAFLSMLSEMGYTFYDENGVVNVFDIRVEGPEADHECISASLDSEVKMTVLIPVKPVMADTPQQLGTVSKVGIGLDGVPIFSDAPSVLDRSHMPALDTCGGHVDPGGWYHWHTTATDIDTVYTNQDVAASCANVPQDPSAQFAFAFDGFAIYGSLEANGSKPIGLDQCGGHIDTETGIYHYHASDTFPNLPSCLVGVVAKDNFSTTASAGIGSNNARGGPGGRRPDLTAIAAKLGVTTGDLRSAIKAEGGPGANLAQVAERLGISASKLQAAFPRRP